jgi:pimeloyl-ACP methyl ester carboxylesterase
MSLAGTNAWSGEVPDDAASNVLAAAMPPTSVIGGAEDILSGVRPVRAMASALGATLHMIPGCGHYPWVEQPEAFIESLQQP